MVKTLGRKKPGPKAPVGGRVRVTVNLPRGLLRFVDSLKGRSRSDNIVLCLTAAAGWKESNMAMELLRTATLVDVRDGMLAHQIDAELVKVHADCVERPGLKKARTVTLTISITPPGTDDPLDGAEVEFSVKASLPATSIVRQMKSLRKRNGFAFDADTDSLDHDSAQQRLGGIDED